MISSATSQEEVSLLLTGYSTLPGFSGLGRTDANSLSLFGDRPTHIAAARGDIDKIQLILGHGADVSCKGEHEYTALHDAVKQGHDTAVEYLLNQGTDPESLNDGGVSSTELVKLLDEDEILYLFERGAS